MKSADALALEMGNSPDVIFRHYRRPMTETKAMEYFSIVPRTGESPATVIDAAAQMSALKILDFPLGNIPATAIENGRDLPRRAEMTHCFDSDSQ